MCRYPRIILLATTVATSAMASTAQAGTPAVASCPATPPRASAPIMYAIAHSKFAPLKRKKLDELKLADVQALTDVRVCEALEECYATTKYTGPDWQRAYFKTRGYYMSSVFYVGANRRRTQRGHVALFSGKLRLVTALPNKL